MFLMACTEDTSIYRNPFLPLYNVDVQVNMNLALYNQLQIPGNAIHYHGQGINGILIINTGSNYLAYEATCSNHQVTECSGLSLKGIEATCGCEDATTYNLHLGIPVKEGAKYPLLQYRVVKQGNVLRITN